VTICQPQSLHREWFETVLKITSSSDQCHFAIEQTEVDPGVWRVTELDFNFKGSMLIFKSLNIRVREHSFKFQRLPDHLSFQDAIEMLRQNDSMQPRSISLPPHRLCWALEADCQSIAL
jgi:hypothetical protein